MGLLFGKNAVRLSNSEIDKKTFNLKAEIKTILSNNTSKSEVEAGIRECFFNYLNSICDEENSLTGIYTYSMLEEEAVKDIIQSNKKALKKYNINLYKYTLEPKLDDIENTDSSRSYINKSFAKHIANWPNDKYENLLNSIKNHAKENYQSNPDVDLTEYSNQLDALKNAKKERPFIRKIIEFFNGTFFRQNKLIKDIKEKLQDNFVTENRNDRLEREQKERQNEIDKSKTEVAKKQIFVNELNESEIDFDELTDEQFEAIERQNEEERLQEIEK